MQHTFVEFVLGGVYSIVQVLSLWRIITFQLARKMPMLVVYLVYSVFRTLATAVVLLQHSGSLYWQFYWPLQGIGYVLSGLLALSLLYSVIPQMRSWKGIAAVLFFLSTPFLACFAEKSWEPLLNAVEFADLACGALLLMSLEWLEDWREPFRGIACGLVIGLSGHLFCALWQSGDPALPLRLCYQASAVAQVSVWYYTIYRHTQPESLVASAF